MTHLPMRVDDIVSRVVLNSLYPYSDWQHLAMTERKKETDTNLHNDVESKVHEKIDDDNGEKV